MLWYLSVIRLGEGGILWRRRAFCWTLPQRCWRRFKQFEKFLPMYWHIGANNSEKIATFIFRCRPQCPRGLRRWTAASRLLRLLARTPRGIRRSVSFECCLLPVQVSVTGRSLVQSSSTECVCLSVIEETQSGDLDPLGVSRHEKKNIQGSPMGVTSA